MPVSKKRLVHIIACMYYYGAEVVIDDVNSECYIYVPNSNDLEIFWEEVDCLIDSNIIELESGCSEEGQERRTFTLSNEAKQKVCACVDKKAAKN